MYSIAILLLFIAFLIFYNTSKKSNWADKPAWATTYGKQKQVSLLLSAILMLISCGLLIYLDGTVAGIFSFVVITMAMGNVIVLLFPFRYVSISHVILLFLFFAGLEQFIF